MGQSHNTATPTMKLRKLVVGLAGGYKYQQLHIVVLGVGEPREETQHVWLDIPFDEETDQQAQQRRLVEQMLANGYMEKL